VEDDGEGFPARYRAGTGLGNLRERLDAIYGADAAVHVEPGPGGRVQVSVPAVPCAS
jgi:signal transduction histidine kinase